MMQTSLSTPRSLSRQLAPGHVLDSGLRKYVIKSTLGQGGFGITYLATSKVKIGNVLADVNFAVKEHFPENLCSREGNDVKPDNDKKSEFEMSCRDFVSEAKKLQNLGSKNNHIVKVNEVFEANSTAYYVMQYVEGSTLASYIEENGKIPEEEALKLIDPILDAVALLHNSRMMHLDIKPDNIMLQKTHEDIEPVLIDFGLSLHFKKNGERTSARTFFGVSDGYSPLEQYAGISEFNPSTDIYSLAATLLFMLTGKKPAGAADLKRESLAADLKGLASENVVDAISRAMSLSFKDRQAAVGQFKRELNLDDGVKTRIIASDSHEKTLKSGIANNKKIRYGLGVAILVCLVFLIFWMFPYNSASDNPSSGKETLMVEPETEKTNVTEPVIPVEEEPSVGEIIEDREPENISEIKEGQEEKKNSVMKETPVKTEATIKKVTPVENKMNRIREINLGYGTWVGPVKNGQPDGRGKITFTSSHLVDNSTTIEAKAGDYFIATYENGRLLSGKLYDVDGNILKTVVP